MTEIPPADDFGDGSAMAAAFAYIRSGLYIGPLRQGTKHPGSMLGKGWHAKTFNDAESVATWFAGVDLGVFLHCGRSGLVVLDIDEPDAVPAEWWPALAAMPFQRSRPANGRRGHYIAATPPGRRIGNAIGRARRGWGEVRGENGVIVLAPTRHEKADEGARYEWVRSGPIPVLPAIIADLLPDQVGERTDAATDAEARNFRALHASGGERPLLAHRPLGSFARAIERGGSRHVEAVRVATWMAEEIAAGLYGSDALDTLESMFRGSYTAAERARHRGDGREWAGIVAWAIGRVTPEKVAAIRERYVELSRPDSIEPGSVVESLTADATQGWDALWS